uniref:Uncharacterized protein n=1 Tax=Trypanosoma congolense (strain IL3000) TaxID=1068625 RepID=G0UPB4_TRYCI|nr:conserved hypothetical protein [Trypanosoma congolense IL3000]
MPHVCVWFVQHVVRALFLHKSRARSAEGTRARHDSAKVHNDNNINRARFSSIGDGVNTESSSRAMREWQEATDASLQCLGRVLLHLPSARHGSLTHEEENMQKRARQKVYCLLFEGILEGVFSTTCGERSSKSASTCNIPPAMATLLQVYNETDWRYPSVAIFVKCLHAWGLHEMLRRVFYHVYRRERGQQPTYNGKKSNDGSVLNNGAGCAAKPKRYSLSLYTCELVIESACRARDPSTAALAVDYMLSQLLHLRSAAEQQPHEDVRSCGDDNNTAAVVTEDLIGGRCIAEWTRLIHEEIVPRVDKVFCQTGIDTKRQWMDDISEAKVAVASAVQ